MTEILSRRERKKEETRHRIFHAAVDLFRHKGFEQTTVDDITEKADVARGTFFNYFPRKDAVLAFLSESRLTELEEDAGALLAQPRPAREKILDLLSDAASAYAEDRELSRYVLVELMRLAFSPANEVMARWHEQIVRLVVQGQETGDLRRDLDPVRCEELLQAVYYATLYQWVCEGPAPGLDSAAPAAAMCLPHGFQELQAELRTRLMLVMEGIAT
jgi:AcrR family transcriptional regulator